MFKIVAHTPRGKFEFSGFEDENKDELFDLLYNAKMDLLKFTIGETNPTIFREEILKRTIFEFVDIEENRQ